MGELSRTIEALLFLAPDPLSIEDLTQATEASEQEVRAALDEVGADFAPGARGIALRELAHGFALASDPATDEAARRLFGRERRASLTQAQAETLAIVAYLQPVSRPEIARIRGVSADWAVSALLERDLVEEVGRSEVGATLYRTSTMFLKHFGLRSLDELPDLAAWDPTPEEAGELRDRLLRAGDARAGTGAGTDSGAGAGAGAGTGASGLAIEEQPAQDLDAELQTPEAAQAPAADLHLDRWERELLAE